MTSLIFHGGHYKTGTTSLQHELRASEAGLAAAGILYPRGLPDARFSDVQHADLVSDCFAGQFDRVESYLKQVAEEAKAKQCGTVLLSSELATSFHRFPERFTRWLEIAEKYFERPRYVFVVRDALGYTTSMYRELVKSGRASFHFEAVRDELTRLLTEQQRSIAFFRNWNASRTTFYSFAALSEGGLVQQLARKMIGYEFDALISMHLNSSQKKAQNIAALLLNDVYALIGAARGLDPLTVEVQSAVKASVKRGKLRRTFTDELAAEVEVAFLSVTEKHARRALDLERAAFAESLQPLPAEIRDWIAAGVPA